MADLIFENKVVFVDIVGFSTFSPVNRQKDAFNQLSEALESVCKNRKLKKDKHVLLLPTGDGFAISFMNSKMSPEVPLLFAKDFQERLRELKCKFKIRTGIHTGTDYCIKRDINNRPNAIGDCINIAQRVMDVGDKNHILLSEDYYNLIKGIGFRGSCKGLGEISLKHGVKKKIYSFSEGKCGNASIPSKAYENVLAKPFAIVLRNLWHICEQIESCIRLKVNENPSFRASLLFYNGDKNCLTVSPFRVLDGKQFTKSSNIAFSCNEGPIGDTWNNTEVILSF